MAFTDFIAHQILRTAPGTSINTHLRKDAFAINGVLEELAYELKTQLLRKGSKNYGRFSNDMAAHPLPAWLNEFRNERLSFTSFTQKAADQFKLLLENDDIYLDGYLVFALEKIEAGQILYIYLLEHMSGLYLDSELNLSESRFLDTAGFGFAAKVQLSDWDDNTSTYLTLMRAPGEKEIAEAFTKLTGFSDKHDIKSDTLQFLQAVDDFSETLDETAAKLTRTKVIDYCLEQHKAGKPVVIEELSQSLSSDIKHYAPEQFVRHMEEKQPELTREFIADSSQLRNYVRISGRSDLLSMSFASECLGKDIIYDEMNDALTIKSLPPALKAKLLKHLKPRD